MLPESPTGSTITTTQEGDSISYAWRATDRHPTQWIPTFFGGFMVLASIVMPIAILFEVEDQSTPPLPVAWGFGAIVLASGLNFLYAGLTNRRRESLIVNPQFIEYDPGPTAMPMPFMLFFQPAFLHSPLSGPEPPMSRKRFRIETQDLTAFVIERVGERQRLRVDHGADRIEIGTLLREPEREWLAAELTEWLAANTSTEK